MVLPRSTQHYRGIVDETVGFLELLASLVILVLVLVVVSRIIIMLVITLILTFTLLLQCET